MRLIRDNELVELEYYNKTSGYIKITKLDSTDMPKLFQFNDINMLELEQKLFNDGYKLLENRDLSTDNLKDIYEEQETRKSLRLR